MLGYPFSELPVRRVENQNEYSTTDKITALVFTLGLIAKKEIELKIPHKRYSHKKLVGSQAKLGFGGHVISMTWQFVNRKPFNVLLKVTKGKCLFNHHSVLNQ